MVTDFIEKVIFGSLAGRSLLDTGACQIRRYGK
jgi:hypothetical protein